MLRKAVRATVLAATTTAVLAAPAVADTTYPQTGGATFDSDTQGWKDVEHSCTLLVLPSTLCSTSNTYGGEKGATAPGSIKASYTSTVGLLNLLTGTSVWRSPEFTAAFNATSPATLRFARAASIQALLDVGGQASTQVRLVDLTAGTTTNLYTTPITTASTDFRNEAVSVPAGLLRQGRKYTLDFVTTFTATTLSAVNPQTDVFYDDIALVVPDGTDAGNVAPSVQTLNASGLTDVKAQLNGLVNPKGLAATNVGFDYGPTTAYGNAANTPDLPAGTDNVPVTAEIGGLTKCTTYHFRVRATNAKGTALGQDLTFTTDCQPTATTLPASPVGATGAVLNGSITPNGPEATYFYEYGETTAYGTKTRVLTAGSGREAKQPLSEPITGLKPETAYHARIVAGNSLGVTQGNDVVFTTPAQSGPGPQGSTGTPGTPGAPGAPGKTTTVQSNTNSTLRNGDARALLVIRSSLARVGLLGRRAGQIRLPIFCKKETGRSCAGTVKLRSRVKINPSSKFGVKKKSRLVTLATFEYQLAAGKKGYAIATIQPEKLDLMRLRKKVKVNISVQVTDANNNRQTIVRKGTFVAQKTV